jgi:uncharacterized integral membrane protein
MKILKTIFFLIIFVILVYFCTKNASAVTLDLLFTKIQTQLYLMMLFALLAGALLVGLTTFFEHARLKRQLRKLRKQHVELQSKFKQLEKSQEASAPESMPSSQAGGNSG